MELYLQLHEIPDRLRGCALTIGNFDGVHRGHARIIERLKARAAAAHGPAVVFTFDPHPVRLLRPSEAPPPLTWTDRKAAILQKLGVDALLVYPTDQPLLSLTPAEFFRQIVVERLAVQAMVEGPNFFFGHQRAGDVEVLGGLCAAAAIRLEVVEPLVVEGEFVSSSRVRRLLVEGDLALVRRLLTEPYRIRGMVTHGAGRGASIGFPTANIGAIDTLLPAKGVYAGRAYVNQAIWPAAIHIGPNPTFGEELLKVEAHLIGFEGPLYGQPLEVDFLARLREIRPFSSVPQLQRQLKQDVAQSQRIARAAEEEAK